MTDKNIRALFWQPNRQRDADPDFFESLHRISMQDDVADYTECNGGLRVRVERLNFQEDFLEGDFVRQQIENVPPFAQSGQTLTPNPNPIGHRAAFRFVINGNILGIQSSRPGVSVSAINSYIKRRIPGHRGFFMDPCLATDALDRIRNGEARRVELRVARPQDLNHVDPNLRSVEDSLASLREFVEGQTVSIGVGFERGNRHTSLNLRRVLDMVSWAGENRGQVEKMTVKLAEENDPIDVLAERLDQRGVVDLDPNDLDCAFNSRIEFIRGAFDELRDPLRQVYGTFS